MRAIGSRRLGRAAELLGESSVVVPLTARAPCPVVVVRAPEHTEAHPPTLVVGVDGSERSRSAVAFAVREASLREARLRAVWVWPRPLLAHEDTEAGLSERRRLLAESVAGWTDHHPDVEILRDVVRGHPVEQLALAARESLALVVGRTGRGGYTGMRLGSTVHGLLHHADCPVITVPSGTPQERGDHDHDHDRERAGRPPPTETDRPPSP
ncbi:universal stress protein [Streptomyces hydrogenans]|uniref:universal stress protein n=1 Tax=Streptomyces hydrogenans TaxID=1873719 RepID=UPI003632F4FB